MSVSYHVFLPPQSLPALPLRETGSAANEISITLLSTPQQDHSSQSTQARLSKALTSQAEIPLPEQAAPDQIPVASLPGSADLAQRPKKRKPSLVDSEESQSQSQESAQSSRRRSSRLSGNARPSCAHDQRCSSPADPISSALPRMDDSESYLSLNTTTSMPSQLPLTAVGNDSLYNLPRWSIPLQRLSSLASLLESDGRTRKGKSVERQFVDIIVCVMAVDAPALRSRKEEKARGKEGTLWVGSWKVTAPSGAGGEPGSCGVKLWETCARDWGPDKVRRGDVVLLGNAEWRPSTSKDPAHFVLSPMPARGPSMTVLYRTLPRQQAAPSDHVYRPRLPMLPRTSAILPEDKALRPDLRLGRSDPGVRKVEEYARWFAGWVGGDPPP